MSMTTVVMVVVMAWIALMALMPVVFTVVLTVIVIVTVVVVMSVAAARSMHMGVLHVPHGDGHWACTPSALGLRWGRRVLVCRPVVVVIRVVMARVVMTVPMPPGVGPGLGFEGGLFLGDDQVHALEHLRQYVIGFDLQVVRLQFDLHVPVAQVVGRAGQIEGTALVRAGAHQHHRLRRSVYPHQGAILGHQHIAAAHHAAALQKHPQTAAQRVHGLEAALLPGIPVQADGGGSLEQHGGQSAPGGHELVDGDHERCKKSRKKCAREKV